MDERGTQGNPPAGTTRLAAAARGKDRTGQGDNRSDGQERAVAGSRPALDLALMSAELMRAIRRITRAVDVQSKRVSRAAGLTIPQIVILQTLRERGALSTGGLAAEISLSAPTVTTVLERLEGRGLVHRTRKAGDRRIVLTALTARGREVLSHAPPLMHDNFLKAFADMDVEAQLRLVAALKSLADLMDTGPVHAGLLLDASDPPA